MSSESVSSEVVVAQGHYQRVVYLPFEFEGSGGVPTYSRLVPKYIYDSRHLSALTNMLRNLGRLLVAAGISSRFPLSLNSYRPYYAPSCLPSVHPPQLLSGTNVRTYSTKTTALSRCSQKPTPPYLVGLCRGAVHNETRPIPFPREVDSHIFH